MPPHAHRRPWGFSRLDEVTAKLSRRDIARLQSARGCALEIGEPVQRRRLGHIHVVADDNPQSAAAAGQVPDQGSIVSDRPPPSLPDLQRCPR
uniref:Uncharacterized protein n=1 Tax=Cereibacter sphaeroides (strain ATCC 17025 / ATH 2.4.3) TaxID=349102 RepID=A4WZ10_CERS5